MPPISSQRRASTEEDSSLSDDDVGFLYQVVIRAEGHPEVNRLPFRALFAAYDQVIQEHGVDADPGLACQRFLFKMGSKDIKGPTLFEKFENALHQMGIVIDLGEDGLTGGNDALENQHHAVDNTNGHNGHSGHSGQTHEQDHTPLINSTSRTPRRRASFNTTLDIGEDITQRSFIQRPSSRSSMSRLQTGKPEFSKPRLSPNLTKDTPRSPDRTQLIAQFLEVGRRLISRFDTARNRDVNAEPAPLTNGVVARSAVHHDRSKRAKAASHVRRSPSISSSNSLESGESQYATSHVEEDDLFEKQDIPPEYLSYRPQLSDLLRDADTFNMYRQRAMCRKILTQWLKRAFQTRQIRETRESVAMNRDRNTLLRQAFEPWRTIIQQKRHSVRTERFFKHLDERANRARDLYLMTKAFTHWAQLSSEEVARTSAARHHVLSVKYFNAWREITAVNELKAQRFALQRPFNKWRQKALSIKAAETQAISTQQKNLKHTWYWEWFWTFCDRRAPEWYDHRLKSRSLLYWLRRLRNNRALEHELVVHNQQSALAFAFEIWSSRSRQIISAQQQADNSLRHKVTAEIFGEWRTQMRLAPAASHVTHRVETRLLRNTFSMWILKARMTRKAQEIDQLRIKRNAWTSWNDTLRCLALRARIDERLKMEIMYKWILAERFQLMRRIREQRIKQEVFTRFVTNTRSTYTRLLFHAEIHEDQRAEDLMRSKFSVWRDQLLLQRERDDTAFEFYAPRLAQESLTAWRAKYQKVQQMEGWARNAQFYFLMKRTLKGWHEATLDSAKRRRKEAYAKVRRKIKMRLASNALASWQSNTQHIIGMEQNAEDVDRKKLLIIASEVLFRWHGHAMRRVQDIQDADYHYFRQVAFSQLIKLSEIYVTRREMEDQADVVYRSHILRQSGASFRKLSLRIFQITSTVETAEAMRERTLRKHSRNFFRTWLEKARLKLEALDSPAPLFTPARFSNFGEIGLPMTTTPMVAPLSAPRSAPRSVLFDPWYQNPSETPFKLSDITTNSQTNSQSTSQPASQATSQATSHDPTYETSFTTPNYLASPSKRAARARALAQVSTTPATPTQTPFASRLLRVETSIPRTASALRPRSRRGNSISVRFADDEIPDSPTEARKSASRSRT
ncbi:Sfi1 spindle body [Penicillium taxi]|uniref:Sfi1 spindle body n=1 Tax=Penicillium taxi TaxID=168475 RepID=UPI002544EEAD|nr:Sfi1 spindle body [Penicillium taxi]KAJ5901872.1 Sfi1 spindle body [Penicillium taxi]